MVTSVPDSTVHLTSAQNEAYFTPFVRAGILSPVDVHVVDALHRLVPNSPQEALLACALAVRAPRHGHICIDLKTIDQTVQIESIGRHPQTDDDELKWPDTGWAEYLRASPLVHEHLSEMDAEDITCPFVLHGTHLYMNRYWRYQVRLASAIRSRIQMSHDPIDHSSMTRIVAHLFSPQDLTVNRQALGVAMAVRKNFAVISGGPGMGKTFTVRNMLTALYWVHEHSRDAYPEARPSLRVALAAPTGKAAARLKESIADGLTGHIDHCGPLFPETETMTDFRTFLSELESFTVHRLLGFNPKNQSRFRFGRENPLPYDVVIIDEASMVDFAMMSKLVDAVHPKSKLILLGDKHQLASVDAGSVLRDLCGPVDAERLCITPKFAQELSEMTAMPVTGLTHQSNTQLLGDCIVQLNRNYRFDDHSGIGAFARACLQSNMTVATSVFEAESGYSDIRRLEYDGYGRPTPELRTLMVKAFSPYIHKLYAGPGADEADDTFHAEVLALFDGARFLCTHRSGPMGVDGVNGHIERCLTDTFGQLDFSTHQWGYLGRPVMVTQNDYSTGLYNGDIGLFVDCRVEGKIVRRVAFPQDNGVRYIAPARLPTHSTAYAMTIHKSQGSQFHHAIVILPKVVSPIVTRELIYTGVTRAGQQVTLVGPSDVLKDGLQQTVQRASGLRSLLWNQ